jgi:hypothetical protein
VSIEQASDCRNWAGLGHLAVLAVDPVRLDATGGTRQLERNSHVDGQRLTRIRTLLGQNAS